VVQEPDEAADALASGSSPSAIAPLALAFMLGACGGAAGAGSGGSSSGNASTGAASAASGSGAASGGASSGSSDSSGSPTSSGPQGPGGVCLASPPPTMACAGGVTTGLVPVGSTCWGPGELTLPETGFTVGAGATLTINPGTTVTGTGVITVNGGALSSMGAPSAPVKLFDTAIELTGGSHTIQYTILNSESDNAVDVDGASVTISHMQIQRFTLTGLNVHGANAKATVDFSTFGTTTTLFALGAGDAPTPPAVAVTIDAAASMGGSSITNSSLGFLQDAFNNGLDEEGTSSNLHLAYDFISGTANTIVTTDVAGVFNAAPGIADIPNLNHNLGPFAPALDRADPSAAFAREPAPNGGRANIGYYGGTECAQPTTVQLILPAGCESYPAGSTQTFTWHASPDTPAVPPPGTKTLAFSADNGATWQTLASIPAGSDPGTATVMLPAIASTQCQVRYSEDNDPTHITSVTPNFEVGAAPPASCIKPPRCPATDKTCKPFDAIAYEGYRDGQLPGGPEPTCAEVEQDLMILEPYTRGIRTYSSDPTEHDGMCIPGIADELSLDFHMGVWVDSINTDAINFAAIDASVGIVCGAANAPDGSGCPKGKAAHPSIKTVIVGNEYLLRVRQAFGDTTAEEKRLVSYIQYARARIPSSIEVVTAETYSDWLTASAALYEAVDRIIWHSHPWWEQIPIADAAARFATTHDLMVANMARLGISKPERCGETGWPWDIDNGAAIGSEANQAQYLHDLNAYSVASGLDYWFFEGFDEAWKVDEGAVGGKWGMWTSDRTAPPHPVIVNLATEIPASDEWP
jgi:exo-beta-1,3-glucanase (GH17 family)